MINIKFDLSLVWGFIFLYLKFKFVHFLSNFHYQNTVLTYVLIWYYCRCCYRSGGIRSQRNGPESVFHKSLGENKSNSIFFLFVCIIVSLCYCIIAVLKNYDIEVLYDCTIVLLYFCYPWLFNIEILCCIIVLMYYYVIVLWVLLYNVLQL